jgi:hypothetical protein
MDPYRMSTNTFSAAGTIQEEPMSLQAHLQKRIKDSAYNFDNIPEATNGVLHFIDQNITPPTLFYTIADSLNSYRSEIQYMASWESLTRSPNSRFDQSLEQIKCACPLDPFDREAVLAPLKDLMDVYEESLRLSHEQMVEEHTYLKYPEEEVGSCGWWHGKISHYYNCLDRLNFM